MSTVIPILFTPSVVRQTILQSPGAYVLGDWEAGAFRIGYVGRSDEDVRQRLAGHERLGEFGYVIVRYAPGAVEAFWSECEFWHACHQTGITVVNRIHPAAPRGSGLACPYCHFATHVGRLLAA